MPPSEGPPDYDRALKAYHAAFEPELEAAVRRYELGAAARVLDSPCGDGFYAKLFARHMRSGTLTATDLSSEYLAHAKRSVGPPLAGLDVQFVEADAYALPFDDASFDLVWCAQSFISLDDPLRAVCEMARVLKPGGRLAVLETDEYHHVLLPWPVKLELAVAKAVRTMCERRYGSGAKWAQARKLRGHFRDAGLTPTVKRTIAADRVAPFGESEREFLLHHFRHQREFIRPEMEGTELEEFDRFTSEADPESFLNSPEAELTCLATVCHARK